MKQLLRTRSDKEVFLRIDGKLTVQDQMKVGDQLTAAGVEKMGVITDPPSFQ
jgi:biopolymer transport protein ExbD